MCSFVPVNLTGESSALSAAPFRACTETMAPVAETVAVVETPAVVETAVSVTPEATLPTPEPPAVSQTMPGSATPAPLRDAESGAPATRVLLAQTLWTLFDRPAAEGDVYFSVLPADTDAGAGHPLGAAERAIGRATVTARSVPTSRSPANRPP